MERTSPKILNGKKVTVLFVENEQKVKLFLNGKIVAVINRDDFFDKYGNRFSEFED